MDAHWRSIAKAVTYRLSSSCVTFAVACGITGEAKTAAAIGTCDVFAKIATGPDERAGRWIGTSKCGGECGIHTRPLKAEGHHVDNVRQDAGTYRLVVRKKQ